MIESGYLELIAAIHHGAVETPPWSNWVRLLRRAFKANSANLVLREAGAAPDDIFAVEDYGDMPPPRMKEAYFQEFYSEDPFPYFEMPQGAVYRLAELLGSTPVEESRFYTLYLRPAGLEHLILFHAAEPGGCRAWVTLTRGHQEKDFLAQDLALCRVLADQLSVALESFATLQTERMSRQLYAHAAQQLNVDFLLLDDRGRLFPSETQGAQVRDSGLGIGPDGRIYALDAAFNISFQNALSAARQGRGGILHVSETPYLDVFISPLAQVQPPHPALGREMPAIVVYLHRGPVQVLSRHIETLFGLSGTEARLAAALAHGRTLMQAAGDVGVTEQTARRYSKLIFSKTGANRQSELIRKILGSAAILAR